MGSGLCGGFVGGVVLFSACVGGFRGIMEVFNSKN